VAYDTVEGFSPRESRDPEPGNRMDRIGRVTHQTEKGGESSMIKSDLVVMRRHLIFSAMVIRLTRSDTRSSMGLDVSQKGRLLKLSSEH